MNFEHHPCFNPKACKTYGRIHLPVAPRCNIQCNFCNRKFDCVNESRPGVSSTILKPFQALAFLDKVMAVKKNISVMGIAGPGDPFANPEETLSTIEMVHSKYPELLLCLASNGLYLPDYLDDIAKFNVSHVSITINAVDPSISEKIYAWVRYGKKSLPPKKGAELLLEKQLKSVEGLKERGIIVKVNTIVLPGINDHHVIDIAKKMAQMDVDILNCMPYYPNEGANFSDMGEPSKEQISQIQNQAKEYIPQMLHCKRCRADAVGLLDEKTPDTMIMSTMQDCASMEAPEPEIVLEPKAPYIAVASREGVLVNQHLGEVTDLGIYDISAADPVLVEYRKMPEPGGKDLRWHKMADRLKDCSTLLVSGVGDNPKHILSRRGLNVLMVNGLIHDVLDGIKNNRNISHLTAEEPFNCNGECQGAGMGCM